MNCVCPHPCLVSFTRLITEANFLYISHIDSESFPFGNVEDSVPKFWESNK